MVRKMVLFYVFVNLFNVSLMEHNWIPVSASDLVCCHMVDIYEELSDLMQVIGKGKSILIAWSDHYGYSF